MPYTISKTSECPDSKPYGVVKKSDGKVMGCHETREKAAAQIGAIEANESKERDMDTEEKAMHPGVISFDDLESMRKAEESAYRVYELTDTFTILVRNIYNNESIDTQSAFNRLVGEFQQRVERAMNPNTKETKVPDKLVPQKITHDKDTNEFLVFKSDEGQWRWFAIYSNMYRDDDHPSEIISSKSHRAFTSMVDAGLVDYPELWQWHIDGSAWGKADWLAYADGFAMAAGYIYDGFEFAAKSLATYDGDIRVSHGMPTSTIVRDKNDSSVIIFHITKEISPLPGWAAANKWTGFTILKEGEDMPIPEEKKEHLRTLGYSDDVIARIEGGVEKASTALNEAGIESKDKKEDTVAEVVEEQADQAVSPATTTETVEDAEEGSVESTEDAKEVTLKEEIAQVIGQTLSPLIEATNALSAQNEQLQKQVNDLSERLKNYEREDSEKVGELKENTPARSLAELVSMSLIGNKEARVHGNSSLAKDGPAEKEQEAPNVTPVGFVNSIIGRQRNGSS